MDFLGGALPNVMFIIGMLAIGLGLGIELKLVPLNKEIDKTGRIGAIIIGALLVAGSLYIYLNPSLSNHRQTSPTTANGAPGSVQSTLPATVRPAAEAPTVVPSTVPTAASLSAEAPVSSAVATAVPSPVVPATPAPTATPIPTAVPPTQIARVKIPDVHGLSESEAQETLKTAGLHPRKVDQCSGSDQGDSKAKKHRVQCQNPAANTAAPIGTTVEYVLR
jgi:hypothetical protein